MEHLIYLFNILDTMFHSSINGALTFLFLSILGLIFTFKGFKSLVYSIIWGFLVLLIGLPLVKIPYPVFYAIFTPFLLMALFIMLEFHRKDGKTEERYLNDIKKFFILVIFIFGYIVFKSMNFNNAISFVTDLEYSGVAYICFFSFMVYMINFKISKIK